MAIKKVKVSVIMSTYNAQDYIKQAIDSVLRQTYRDFEFIVTDDCSTDTTLDILNQFHDNRLTVIKNTHQKGLTQNLNHMIEIANGDYIARLDADDICNLTRIEKQVCFLDKNQDIFLVCSYAQAIGEQNGVIKTPRTHDEIAATFLFRNPIVHSSVMFRNERIFYDSNFKRSQDYELWTRLSHAGKRFATIEEPLVCFRYHSSQISNANRLEQGMFAAKVKLSELRCFGVKADPDTTENYKKYIEEGQIKNREQLYSVLSVYKKINIIGTKSPEFPSRVMKRVLKSQYVGLYIVLKNSKIISAEDKLYIMYKALSILLLKAIIVNRLR